MDDFTLKPKQRERLIAHYEKDEDLDALFAKAESFTELNLKVINIKSD